MRKEEKNSLLILFLERFRLSREVSEIPSHAKLPLKLRKVSLSDQPGKVTPAKDSPAKTGSPSRLRAVFFMGAQHERGLGGKSPQGVLTIAYFERLGVPRLS